MIELATKTITAESRIGNHNAVMETIVPPSLLSLHGRAAEDPPKPMPDSRRSQLTTAAASLVRVFLSPSGRLRQPWDRNRGKRARRPKEGFDLRYCRLQSAHFYADRCA